MAANYWTSTQHRFWHFTSSQLTSIRSELQSQNASAINQYPIPDHRHILIFLKDQLLRLSSRHQSRQQCLATTLVYIHRYLLTRPLQSVNPYLLLTTAYYLASKTEESPSHIRLVLNEARHFWPEFVRQDVAAIGEMEFSIISELRSQLIVWHPYRTLMDLKLPENEGGLDLSNNELGMAWNIINDSYLTDLPLTCAPHIIAVMAIVLAVTFQPANQGVKASNGLPAFQLPNTPTSTINNPSTSFPAVAGRPGMSTVLGITAAGLGSSRLGASPGADANTKTSPRPGPSEKMLKVKRFIAHSSIDLQRVISATQEIISLYEVWDSYSEKGVKETLARVIRGRGLDK